MKYVVGILCVLGTSLWSYHVGFDDGDLARRLQDVDMMSQQTTSEMQRHYAEENYWNDRAWDCEAQFNHGQPVKKAKAQ